MGAYESFQEAQQLKYAGDLKRAAAAFAKALRGDLKGYEYHALDAAIDTQRELANWAEVETLATRLASLAKKERRGGIVESNAWVQKSIALQKLGKEQDAVKAADAAVKLEKANATAHYQRACALAAAGQLRESFDSVKQALRYDASLKAEIKRDADLEPLCELPQARALLGAPAKKKSKFPELPNSVEEAFALFASLDIALPRAAKTKAQKLPSELAAFYERAAKLPGVSSDAVYPAGGLAALNKRFAQQKFFAFGTSNSGDYFFFDPKHGDAVFRFEHEEEEVIAETTSFGAFIALKSLAPWAEAEGLEAAHERAVDKQRAAARKLKRK